MPKFSVVISVYNKEGFIADTLKSVLSQTVQDFEIVILDDGSTDGSAKAINPFLADPRISCFSKSNQGIATGRNFLIEKAVAPYIAFLDADDLWHPNYLKEQKRLIEKYPQEQVFAVAGEFLIGKKKIPKDYSISLQDRPDAVLNYFDSSFHQSLLHSSSFVVKKELFEEVGVYNTALKTGEDTDLYVRIGLKYPIAFSPVVCAQHRVVKNSLSKSEKNLSEKPTFKEYEVYEAENPSLKKFLDLNRFAFCILAKIQGDSLAFKENFEKIDLSNLTKKQLFLIRRSPTILRQLKNLQSILNNLGIRSSAFK